MSERTDMIKEAQRLARKLKRPWSVSPARWAVMQDVLIELAHHVPEVRPKQEALATKLGTYRFAIRRALDGAEANGFIKRTVYDNFHGQWDGTCYQLLWWPGHTQVSEGTSNSTVATNVVIPVATCKPRSVATSKPLNGGSTNRSRNGSHHSLSESGSDGGPPPPQHRPRPSLSRQPGDRKPGRLRNQYGKRCYICSTPVRAKAGFLHGKEVVCMDCDFGLDPNHRLNTYVPPQWRGGAVGGSKRKRTIPRSPSDTPVSQ